MRNTFFVSTLLTVFTCVSPAALQAQKRVVSPARTSINHSVKNSSTRFVIRTRAGKSYSLSVNRDCTVAPSAAPSRVKVLAEINGSMILIADTYPSLPGGMPYCLAGEERFLRVISLDAKSASETIKLKIESCRDGLKLDSDGIEWVPRSSTLRVRWLTGPATSGAPELRTINLTPRGSLR